MPVDAQIVGTNKQYNAIKTKANPFGVDQYVVAAGAVVECSEPAATSDVSPFKTELVYQKDVAPTEVFSIVKKVAILSTRHHLEKAIKKATLAKLKLLKSTTFALEEAKHAKL